MSQASPSINRRGISKLEMIPRTEMPSEVRSKDKGESTVTLDSGPVYHRSGEEKRPTGIRGLTTLTHRKTGKCQKNVKDQADENNDSKKKKLGKDSKE